MAEQLINGRTAEVIKSNLNYLVRCETCPQNHEYGCEFDERTKECRTVIDALALIEHLEAQQPKWISVEERLPERHGQLCVGLYNQHGGDKSMLFPYIFTWHAYGDNGYVKGPHFSDEGLDGLKVYYWMPLPEPPKEDA